MGLDDVFECNFQTGELLWRDRPREHFATTKGWKAFQVRCAGKRTGHPNSDGYLKVRVGRKDYAVHRVIWFLANGTWPVEIDHINGDKSDNRIANLRDVSHSQNMANKRRYSTNKSGQAGVSWEAQKRLWVARISVNGRVVTLGRSKDVAVAIDFRKAAEEQFGYHANHGRAA